VTTNWHHPRSGDRITLPGVVIAVLRSRMMVTSAGPYGDIETGSPMAELIYELSFKGVASETLHAAFDGFGLTPGSGVTLVRCSHGDLGIVIARIEELGLELLDVRLVVERSLGRPRDG
jgi:hypothetical protein